MITAKEAKHQTLRNTRAREYIESVERSINYGIEHGHYETTVSYWGGLAEELVNIICEELSLNGYKFEYTPNKPCPSGCRSDQWDDNAYLKISWK